MKVRDRDERLEQRERCVGCARYYYASVIDDLGFGEQLAREEVKCTFPDDLGDLAMESGHCTLREALGMKAHADGAEAAPLTLDPRSVNEWYDAREGHH